MSPDLPKPCSPGSDDDKCPSPPSSDGSRHLVTPLVVTAFVLVFLSLVSLSIYCFIRRRRRRRRQPSLLAAGAANPGAQGDGPAPEMAAAATATDVEGGAPGPEDETVHHAWHIRTVGLDEKAIESIALTRYRAGAGTLGGAADCSVCLGEFLDGELLRLLPKCGHAFHVPCIGTWLRAHVNCPLCRADVVVLDSAATGGSDPPADDAQRVSSSTETLNHERPGPAQRQNEQEELRVQIDQRNRSRSPEPPRRRMQNFRRVASMDLSVVSAGPGLVQEDKRSSAETQGNGDAASGEVSSGSGRLRYLSGGGRRSLLSGHRRTSSSMLPS